MDSNSSDNKRLSRQQALKKVCNWGKNITKAILPIAGVTALSSKANAQFGNLEVVRALNYLLQIEFMQELFYARAVVKDGFLSGKNRTLVVQILRNQQAHVILLKSTIRSLDEEQAPQLDFDFTAQGKFQPFSDFDQFLMLAQVIEDTAVGVYKQQMNLIHENGASNITQRLVMRMQSTEARHSYFVRALRQQRGVAELKGWTSTEDINTIPDTIQNIYQNEGSVIQNNVDVPSITNVDEENVKEAWDEPIDRGLANNIFELFRTRFQ